MASFLSQERVAAFPSGHGVGLEYRDYPIVVPDTGLRISDECVDRKADLPLEIGMVLNVEATAFLAGGSAVGCEVTCLVTSGDPLLLSPEDRSLRISKGLRS
jgi:Xaa-Pro aminopeptidase